MTVKYGFGVPAIVRRYCDQHADQVHSVDCAGYSDDWRYMAWLRAGWNQGDDCVHSVIGSTAADLIAHLRLVDRCDCDACRDALNEAKGES